MLPFIVPDSSKYRLLYSGPVGVSGVNVQQTWDLTKLPTYVRKLQSFKDNFRIFVRQVDPGVSAVSKTIDFVVDGSGIPVGLVLTLTAASPDNLVDIEAWYIHSVVR